jgi:membrane protein
MNLFKGFIIGFYKTVKFAILHFIEDNAIQLSAALSFYTLFAIAPIIIIIISLAGIFLGMLYRAKYIMK